MNEGVEKCAHGNIVLDIKVTGMVVSQETTKGPKERESLRETLVQFVSGQRGRAKP